MAAHLKAVLQMGLNLGNHANVFIKVGDSISAASQFLTALGDPSYNANDPTVVGSFTNLASTISYFRSVTVNAAGENSFTHVGLAARSGWLSGDVLNPANFTQPTGGTLTPLAAEIKQTHPAVALIMLGTNDLAFNESPDIFRNNLTIIGVTALQEGVIPVFSSIPERLTGGPSSPRSVLQMNQIISDVAFALNVPFWNYWLAMSTLPNQGISSDQVHPSTFPGGSGYFTSDALQYGFNVRNLTAVEVLDQLKHAVIDGTGGTGSGTAPGDPAFIQHLYVSLLGRTPAPSEVNNWLTVISSGATHLQVVQDIWQSQEHFTQEIKQDYFTVLGRLPSNAEVQYWVGVLQSGAPEEEVLSEFLASQEFQNAHPDQTDMISAIYQVVLHRVPPASEAANWVGELQNGVSLHDVAKAIVTSTEAYQGAIGLDYNLYLGRGAANSDQSDWLGGLQSGQIGQAGLAEGILASTEYYNRS
jgi:hypothetical protein